MQDFEKGKDFSFFYKFRKEVKESGEKLGFSVTFIVLVIGSFKPFLDKVTGGAKL